MTVLAFAIVVTDGRAVDLLQPADFTEAQQAAIAHIVRHRGQDPRPPADEPSAPGPLPSPAPAPAAESFLTQGEIAAEQGFTGDTCANCLGFRMVRSGTCATCHDCGATTGCA